MPHFKVEKDKIELVGLDKILWFGKHKGKTIRQVINDGNGSYIQWAINQEMFELDCNGEEFLEESMPVSDLEGLAEIENAGDR